MDFSLTDDQQLLRETAHKLLDRECPPALVRAHIENPSVYEPLWRHLGEYTALGAGPASDLCLFLQETGYVAAPGPFFATTALCTPLLQAIDHPALSSLAEGGCLDSDRARPVRAGDAEGVVACA